MSDPLVDASRRVQRAFSADGLAEITTGILLFLPALLAWAKLGLDHHDPVWRLLNAVQFAVILPGVWIAIWLLPRLRNRLFGHREGIMIPRLVADSKAKAVMAFLVAASMGALLVIILRKTPNQAAITTLMSGLAGTAILCKIGSVSGLRRYFALAAIIAGATVAIAAQGADFETSFIWQFGFMGLLLMATGAVTLVRFLHAPHAPGLGQ